MRGEGKGKKGTSLSRKKVSSWMKGVGNYKVGKIKEKIYMRKRSWGERKGNRGRWRRGREAGGRGESLSLALGRGKGGRVQFILPSFAINMQV